MQRRYALVALFAVFLSIGAYSPDLARFGAEPSKVATPTFNDEFPSLQRIATDQGRNVFLWKYLEKEIGPLEPHDQREIIDQNGRTIQYGEGDCVGQAAALACDILAATEIHLLGEREKFIAKSSVEMIYAGSRNEIGKGVVKGRGGSHGAWAVQYLKEFGVLHRIEYSDGENRIDLSGYDALRSKKYRDLGVPDWLERFAKEHPVKVFSKVQTGREALDAVCSGQPVILCSSYAFPNVRDSEGFIVPYLSGGEQLHQGRWGWFRILTPRKQWWHAMLLIGAKMEGDRIGGVIMNSHGPWNEGPRPYGIPEGSFLIDLEYLDLMVKDWGDCWAISCYEGHEVRRIRHKLYR